ncbi:hypothetical protein ACFE04_021476 [Oxalis oulophora]
MSFLMFRTCTKVTVSDRPKESPEWQSRGFLRKKGRPRMRWRDEVVRHSGVLWGRDTQYRDRWARVLGGLCPEMGGGVERMGVPEKMSPKHGLSGKCTRTDSKGNVICKEQNGRLKVDECYRYKKYLRNRRNKQQLVIHVEKGKGSVDKNNDAQC